MSREQFRREDSDNLADIIWWIKGYIAGADATYSPCPFGSAHVESLRRARVILGPQTDRDGQ
jgi:hypothetical protein